MAMSELRECRSDGDRALGATRSLHLPLVHLSAATSKGSVELREYVKDFVKRESISVERERYLVRLLLTRKVYGVVSLVN